MSQKLPVNNFKWVEDISEVDESFIKSYNGESDEGCFLELNIQYPENVHNLQTDLPFLPERMKIEKVEKLVANLHDKTWYIIYLRNSKQALSHGLVLKKVYRVIKFNQKDLLKPYIDMNNKLGKKARADFEKDFSSWRMIQLLVKLWKIYENIEISNLWQKEREEKRRNYLVSELQSAKLFTKNLLVTEMRKTQILMNKPAYLGLSLSTVINKFWYDYVKPKYREKAKLCYMDTDSFIVRVKTNDIYEDIAEDVETRFDTWNYELNR